MARVTAADVARRIDVPPAMLRRWVRSGLVPLRDGEWTPAAIAQARIVARLRERGHGGQLAFDQIGEVTLKRFSEPTELFVAGQAESASLTRRGR